MIDMKTIRLPSEIKAPQETENCSLRIKSATLRVLKSAAKSNKMTLNYLISSVLDDYVQILQSVEDKGDK